MAKVPWYALTPPPPKDRTSGSDAWETEQLTMEPPSIRKLPPPEIWTPPPYTFMVPEARQFSMVPPVITKLPA